MAKTKKRPPQPIVVPDGFDVVWKTDLGRWQVVKHVMSDAERIAELERQVREERNDPFNRFARWLKTH